MQIEKGKIEITFFVPCYNEEKNVVHALEIVRTTCQRHALSYEILVVDDGSTDQTSAVVKQYASQHPEIPLQLIRNESNLGLGYNYVRTAALGRGEYYMAAYGDLCIPIDQILEKIGQAEIINPYFENPEVRRWSRRVLSKLYVKIVNCLSGTKLRYYNGTVLHKRANILRCQGIGSGFGYQAEILCKLIGEGCTWMEVPFRADQAAKEGSSAFTFFNICSVLGSLLRIVKRRLFRTLFAKPKPSSHSMMEKSLSASNPD